jgi:deoxyribodipyrimidine photo-lyase
MSDLGRNVAVFWFRRDLRLEDNTALAAALRASCPVLPLFVFDTEILNALEDREDRRVEFIHRTLVSLDQRIRERGGCLRIEHGSPLEVWKKLLADPKIKISAVFANHDYEPSAIERDEAVRRLLRSKGIGFHTCKDQVIFEKHEIQKSTGGPYTVFTPYSRRWKQLFDPKQLTGSGIPERDANFLKWSKGRVPSLADIGFRATGFEFPPAEPDLKIIRRYAQDRDRPAIRGTSRLGLHLRFGTVSVRHLVALGRKYSETWLNELIWREFFMQNLFHFPYVVDGPFRGEYASIRWRRDQEQFAAWCEGRTGYPIVDAGMRELNETGFMHNRARMITASFLVKHLLIDWRWGEAYFARRLLDFELASNNGNWQWVAGTGCDAAPYFRIFNPELQTKRFDPELAYVRRWIPELGTDRYPKPIVEHAFARQRALKNYAVVRGTK